MEKFLLLLFIIAIPSLGLSQSPNITFGYDDNGNQKIIEFESISSELDIETISSLLYVYPNPVYGWGNYGYSNLSWDSSVNGLIQSVRLIRPDISLDQEQKIYTRYGNRISYIRFSGPHGYYYLKIKLTDGREVTKKLLKQ